MAARGRGDEPSTSFIGNRKARRYNVMVIESMEIVLFSVALIVFVVSIIMMLQSR
jgi:hypothetical protein